MEISKENEYEATTCPHCGQVRVLDIVAEEDGRITAVIESCKKCNTARFLKAPGRVWAAMG